MSESARILLVARSDDPWKDVVARLGAEGFVFELLGPFVPPARVVAQAQAGDLESQAREIKGVKVLSARVDGLDRAQLRTLVDSLRNKWKSAVVVLVAASDTEIAIVGGVTNDLTSKVQAGKLVQAVALGTGGKGGGRPDMAEGGGKNVSLMQAELERIYTTVTERL